MPLAAPDRSLASTSAGRSRGRALLIAARPRQWTKNLLVFAAPGTAGSLRHLDAWGTSVAAFGLFVAASAGTYLLNDVLDAKLDRLHPVKRLRPIAGGEVTVRLAVATGAVLVAMALALSAVLAGVQLLGVLAAYVAITVAYSLGLKRVAVIEFACVASGFVLRAVAGATAIGVTVSPWFLLVTSFGALMVVAGKRSRGDGRSRRAPGRSPDHTQPLPASLSTHHEGVGGRGVGELLLPLGLRPSQPFAGERAPRAPPLVRAVDRSIRLGRARRRVGYRAGAGRGAGGLGLGRPNLAVPRCYLAMPPRYRYLFVTAPDGGAIELVGGWGRAAPSAAVVHRPAGLSEIVSLLAAGSADRPVLARGLGRSYGDAAQCAGGSIIDCRGIATVQDLDVGAGRVRVGSGVSFDRLLHTLVPRGYFVPVTPGTRFVTVGGAIAADIHGKNHHCDGTLGAHVEDLVLVTPSGVRRIGPDIDAELFWATTGGMGLTGIIAEATIRLRPIETSMVLVDTERATDIDDCLVRMEQGDAAYGYSVAWIDTLARRRHLGRAVLTRANHATIDDLPARQRSQPLAYDPRPPVSVPVAPPVSVLTPFTLTVFNEAWYRHTPRHRQGELQGLTAYFHPLDRIGNWNTLYGPRGFTQYQFVVPFGQEETLRTVLERVSSTRAASFLAVLKRFGPKNPGPLSFPIPGWTLALDLPLGAAGLGELLDGFDELIAAAGGRVYLAKDGRLRPGLVAGMYPDLARWQAIRDRADPGRVLTSDLGRRLGLIGGGVRAQEQRRRPITLSPRDPYMTNLEEDGS